MPSDIVNFMSRSIENPAPSNYLSDWGEDYIFPITEQKLQIINQDTGTLSITGLDINYKTVSETVILKGVNTFSSKKYFRVNDIRLLTITSPRVKNITIKHDKNIIGQVKTDENISYLPVYTTPDKKSGKIRLINVVSSCTNGMIEILTREPGKLFYPYYMTLTNIFIELTLDQPNIPEKTDIKISIKDLPFNRQIYLQMKIEIS